MRPDLVVDQRDHAVVVGDQLAQLLRRTGAACARTSRGSLRSRSLAIFGVPSRLARCHQGRRSRSSVRCSRQIDLVRVVQSAPGLGRIERMVRVGERGPDAERLVLVLAQVVDGAVADPGRVVPGHRQAPNSRSRGRPSAAAAPCGTARCARRPGRRRGTSARSAGRAAASSAGTVLWPFEHQLDLVEAHVGPVPVGAIARAAFAALRRAGRARRCARS